MLEPDTTQADLATENTPDAMEGEQTWPTDEELQQAEEQQGQNNEKNNRNTNK